MDSLAAVSEDENSQVCKGCNKSGHSEKKCWKLHPNLLPKRFRKRENNNNTENPDEKRRRTWPNFQRDDESDEASMLFDFVDSSINLFSDDDDNHFIFLDTCASRLLFLLKSKELLTDFRNSRRVIGTANNTEVVQVTTHPTQ